MSILDSVAQAFSTNSLAKTLKADSVNNMGGVMVDRIPPVRVSAMDHLHTGFHFILSLNEFTYGFQSISNLQRHKEVTTIEEGGVNDHLLTVGQPNNNTYDLSLRRGYIIHGPDDLISKPAIAAASRIPNETARKAALIAINAASPQSALENGPAPGFIQVYDRRKKLVAMFSFLSLGMIEWSFSDLEATSGEPLFENITLRHTGLTLLPATWLPSITQPVLGWVSDASNTDAMAKLIERNQSDFEARQAKMKELEQKKKALDDERLGLLARFEEITAQRNKAEEDARKDTEDKKSKEQEKVDEALKAEREAISKQHEARMKEQEDVIKEQAEKDKANRENILNQKDIAEQRNKAADEARTKAEETKSEEQAEADKALKAEREAIKKQYDARQKEQAAVLKEQAEKDKANRENILNQKEITEQRNKAADEARTKAEETKAEEQAKADEARKAEREAIKKQDDARKQEQEDVIKEQDERDKANKEHILNQKEITEQRSKAADEARQKVEDEKNNK